MRKYLALSLFALACSSESGLEESECSFGIESSEAAPFTNLAIQYEGPEILDLHVEVEGYPELFLSVSKEGKEYLMRTPLHPDGLQGGTLNLSFRVNEKPCGSQTLEISPIQPDLAVGQKLLSDLEFIHNDVLTLFGVDREVSRLSLDPASGRVGGPAHHIAAGILGWYLDDPRSPFTLVDLDEESLATLGGLAQASGLDRELRDLAEASVVSPSQPLQWTPESRAGQLESIGIGRPELENGDELAWRIALARPACKARASMERVWADVISALGPTAKNPIVSTGLMGFAVTNFYLFARSELICASNPHEMVGGNAVPPYLRFEEDRETIEFQSVTYVARTGEPANLIGLTVGLAYFLKGLGSYQKTILGKETAKILDSVVDLAKDKASGVLAQEIGAGEFGGWEFSNIDLNHDRWITIIPQNGNMVGGSCGKICVDPLEIGEEVLVLAPREDLFLLKSEAIIVDGEVLPIEVQFHPTVRAVEPGELIDIEFQISNALDNELRWQVDDGVTQPFTTNVDWGYFSYGTPTDENLYPLLIRAESAAKTGLRKPSLGPIPRRGNTILVIEEFVVFPTSECLSVGQSVAFNASASSHIGQKATITWSPGVEEGVFKAEAEGEYELWATATWPNREPITRQMKVQVGDCQCRYQTFGPAHKSGKFEITGTSIFSQDLGGTVFMLNFPDGSLIQWVSPQPTIVSGSFPASWQAHLGDAGVWTNANGWRDRAFVEVDADGEHFEIRFEGLVRSTAPPGAAGAAFTSFEGDPGNGWYFIDYQLAKVRALKFEGNGFECQNELTYSNR